MAKISDLAAMGTGVMDTNDLFVVVDVTAGTTKKINASLILEGSTTAFARTILDDPDAGTVLATLGIDLLGLDSLADPNDDQILFYDDSANTGAFLDMGSGLAITATTLNLGELTTAWDIGDGQRIDADEIRARDGDHLTLSDELGTTYLEVRTGVVSCNGSYFAVVGNSMLVQGAAATDAVFLMYADSGGGNNDKWRIRCVKNGGGLYFETYESGAWTSPLTLDYEYVQVTGLQGADAELRLVADEGDDNADSCRIAVPDGGGINFDTFSTGAWATMLTIDASLITAYQPVTISEKALTITGAEGGQAFIYLQADQGDNDNDKWRITAETDSCVDISQYNGAAYIPIVTINEDGVGIGEIGTGATEALVNYMLYCYKNNAEDAFIHTKQNAATGRAGVGWQNSANYWGFYNTAADDHALLYNSDEAANVQKQYNHGAFTLPRQPGWNVWATGQTNISTGSWVNIDWGTEVFDGVDNTNTDFNLGTNAFTAPVTGVYGVHVNLWFAQFPITAGGWIATRIVTSNRNYVQYYDVDALATAPSFWGLQSAAYVDMDASDLCYVSVYQSGVAVALDISQNSWFSGMLIA